MRNEDDWGDDYVNKSKREQATEQIFEKFIQQNATPTPAYVQKLNDLAASVILICGVICVIFLTIWLVKVVIW
jgi:hypothetical protein